MGKIFQIWMGFFLILSAVEAFGQKEGNLEKVRSEIKELEAELKTKENRLKTLTEQREDADREIGLKRKHLLIMEQEIRENQNRIGKTEIELQKTVQSYRSIQKLVAKRLVSMYKRGRISDWEILFNLSSWNQAKIWLKYQERIVENDRRNLRLLEEKEKTIQEHRDRLSSEGRRKQILLQEESKEAENLEEKKMDRGRLISTEQQGIQSIQEKLRRKRQAQEAIQDRVRQAAKRKVAPTQDSGGELFAARKGKLDWPVQGKVITKHGLIRTELNIGFENLGIDIEATEEASVRAVFSGEVIWIEWIRGQGNVVMLDHGGKYYTVYGHLDMVFVENGNHVNGGEVIGRIGDRNGLNGSTLHFEIWNGGETHFDPEGWLR